LSKKNREARRTVEKEIKLTKRDKRSAKNRNVVQQAEASERNKKIAFSVLLALCLIAMGTAVFYGVQKNKIEIVKNYQELAGSTKDFGIVVKPSDLGAPKEKDATENHIVVYEDYSCPHCQEFETTQGPQIQSLVEQGFADIEYRSTAFMDKAGADNNNSKRMGFVAACAFENGGTSNWLKAHDVLYSKDFFSPQNSHSDAETLKLMNDKNVKLTKECVKSQKFVPWMKKATEAYFKAPGVTGTPAVFVNGKQIDEITVENIAKAVGAIQ